MTTSDRCGGLLLTGGASTRMGRDKATLEIDGVALAIRTGRLLEKVTVPALEVGPGASGLEAVREDPPGAGPLAALVAGAAALRDRGQHRSALVVACDLPALTTAVLAFLCAGSDARSRVPVVASIPQPLCARFSPSDLVIAASVLESGERSMRALLRAIDPDYLDLDDDPEAVSALRDADTPEDLRAFAVRPEASGDADTLR